MELASDVNFAIKVWAACVKIASIFIVGSAGCVSVAAGGLGSADVAVVTPGSLAISVDGVFCAKSRIPPVRQAINARKMNAMSQIIEREKRFFVILDLRAAKIDLQGNRTGT